ncbi:MAG: ATP-binding protein [Nitrospiraceae bacterium]|nr:ATP-binding protein [Nitrospiraceae bacterium]
MLKNPFLKSSLNRKLIFMMLLLSSMLLSILAFLYVQDEKNLIKEVTMRTADLSQAIQVGVEEVTTTTPESKLEKYLKHIKPKGINEISIISNNDEIIASTNPKKVGAALSQKRKQLIIKAELGEPVSNEGKTYNVILPVVAGKVHYGYVHLTINEEDFSALMRRNMVKKVIAALIVFLIGTVAAVFLSSRYTKPINEISVAAGKVATGDFVEIDPSNRKDEVGVLTRSFNLMVQRLRENHRLEEKLREAEHLSAVGQLSRSMAHEIRNPLNFISLSIDYIKDNFEPGEKNAAGKFVSLISSIKQEIFRLDKLVSDFLDYGKPLKLNMTRVNVGSLFDEVFTIIKAKAESENIKIIRQYDYLPDILIDPDFMKTCVYNIVLNAFQAMPEGGSMTLMTRKEGNRVVLGISDTGPGVPDEYLEKVFEPFFTTKTAGLGLGLATTKRIVEEHGGEIFFQSVPGKGSNVILKLPLPDTEIGDRDQKFKNV